MDLFAFLVFFSLPFTSLPLEEIESVILNEGLLRWVYGEAMWKGGKPLAWVEKKVKGRGGGKDVLKRGEEVLCLGTLR